MPSLSWARCGAGTFDVELTNAGTGVASRWHLVVSPAATDRVGLAVPADVLLDECARFFNLAVTELCGRSRRPGLVQARQATIYAVRELTDLSYPAIGKLFRCDHTAVLHSVQLVREGREHSSALGAMANRLIEQLRTPPSARLGPQVPASD